ncbi:hypothetical protein RQM59_06920 [Flavobacteriaceae bacterium S356]|uniref:Uncharacterized protein n=1 Tax=Asprobacillus argus TaxID=3076534 RepID=A0ABU3LEH5_9FLAO|nr:hypothetical protein [Flavobacteriaceae bacterium S356]
MNHLIETVSLPEAKLRAKVIKRFGLKVDLSEGIDAVYKMADREFIFQLNMFNPAIAYWFGQWDELKNTAINHGQMEVVPMVSEIVNSLVDLNDYQQNELEKIMTSEIINDIHLERTSKKIDDFKELTMYMAENGSLSKETIEKVLDSISDVEVTTEIATETTTISTDDKEKAEKKKVPYRPKTTKEVWDDLYPPVESGSPTKGKYYIRWSAIEWPPLLKDSHMMYCHQRTENLGSAVIGFGGLFNTQEDDEPTLSEIPGGKIQTSEKDDIVDKNGMYVTKTWNKKVEEYWVEDRRMTALPIGYKSFVNMVTIQEPDGTDKLYDWTELEKKMYEKIESSGTKDKIKESITDLLGDITSGLPSALGKLVSPAAGAASTAVVKLILKIISWLKDKLQGSKFETLFIFHRTVYFKGSRPWSIVNHFKIKHGKKKPEKLYIKGLKNMSGYSKLADSVIWRGASTVPAKKPKEDLKTTKKSAIYWPPSFQNGSRLLVPMNSDDDGLYAIAVRTEVKIADFEFTIV